MLSELFIAALAMLVWAAAEPGCKGIKSTFQFDLAVPDHLPNASYGGRVYVRFVLRPEPLSQRWYRRLRQLFLTQFHV